jgi:two-component system, sensor histidine kinase PdtaS
MLNWVKTTTNRIVNFTVPPKRNFDDFYEEAKYILAYKTCLFLIFALSVLSAMLYFFYDPIYSIMTLLGFLGVSIAFFFIRKTGNFKAFALGFNIFGGFLCQLTLFTIKDQPHLVDGIWMIINIIFAFLTIEKKWASLIAIVHGLSYSFFFIVFYNDQITLIKHLSYEQLIATAFNVFVCFFIIYFLCQQYIKTNLYAQNQLKSAQEDLQIQYDIIRKQNIEKTVMLKEIHHRVKNNLQVIISLLRLQSRELENEESIAKFRDTTSRVLTMSLIHEKMYQSEELSRINLEEYFSSLVSDIMDSYQVEFSVNTSILCDISNMGMKPIVPIALIFNELFSNSLKYAFRNNPSDASIDIRLIQEDADTFCLTYSDNGQWIEADKKSTFGLELIETLTEQLDGQMTFSSSPFTLYSFRFKNSTDD